MDSMGTHADREQSAPSHRRKKRAKHDPVKPTAPPDSLASQWLDIPVPTEEGMPAVTADPTRAVTGLQHLAGNQATNQVIKAPEPPVLRPGSKAENELLVAAEATLTAIKPGFTTYSSEIGRQNDAGIGDIQAAKTHLKDWLGVFDEVYKGKFLSVLQAADKNYEVNESVKDLVQGVMVAAALALFAPEALLVEGILLKMAGSTTKRISNLGVRLLGGKVGVKVAKAGEGAIGELGENLAGTVPDHFRADSGPPTASAQLAGDNPSAAYERAFQQLSDLYDAMPQLGVLISTYGELGTLAADLTTATVKLRHREPTNRTAAEILKIVPTLVQIHSEGAVVVSQVVRLIARLRQKCAQVMSKQMDRDQIVKQLWTTWMANLGDNHGMLDYAKLEDHLGPEGTFKYFDFGDRWTSSSDTSGAVEAAKIRWLEQNGEQRIGKWPQTQFIAQTKLRQVSSAVVGKQGMIRFGMVEIDGRRYSYACGSEKLADGTRVVALHCEAPYAYLEGDVPIAEVRDSDITIHCRDAAEYERIDRELFRPLGPAPVVP